jgi:hypothetical protein
VARAAVDVAILDRELVGRKTFDLGFFASTARTV